MGSQESLAFLELTALLETMVMMVSLDQWVHQAVRVQMAKMENKAPKGPLEHQVLVAQMAPLVELGSLGSQVARVLLDLPEYQVRRALVVSQDAWAVLGLLGLQLLTAGMAKLVHLDPWVRLGLQARRDYLGLRAYLGWMVVLVVMALMGHKDREDPLVFLERQVQMVLLELQLCLACQDLRVLKDLEAEPALNWISEKSKVRSTPQRSTLGRSSTSRRS
jgi:hypothetical protein